MSAEPFKPGPQGFMFKDASGNIGHVSLAGEILEIEVGKRIRAFEMHRYFGPTVVNRRTGDPIINDPGKAFWDAFERWQISGKLVDGIRCVVPQWCKRCGGSGLIETGRRMASTCPRCVGSKIEGGKLS